MPSRHLTGATADPIRHGQRGGCERQVQAVLARIAKLPAHLTGDQVARMRAALDHVDLRRADR